MADGVQLDFRQGAARFNGALRRLVQVTERSADQVVFEVAAKVLARIVETWPVDTGVSRASWFGPRRLGPGRFQIGNPQRYSVTIERGLYEGVGPKTEFRNAISLGNGLFLAASGVFSTQAHAPVRRALAEVFGQISREIGRRQQATWGRV